jgi:hypothetical protein
MPCGYIPQPMSRSLLLNEDLETHMRHIPRPLSGTIQLKRPENVDLANHMRYIPRPLSGTIELKRPENVDLANHMRHIPDR